MMGFEIDLPWNQEDYADIEVLVYPSSDADVMDRKVLDNFGMWKDATDKGRILVGQAEDVDDNLVDYSYTVLLMNKSDVPGKRAVLYGGAAFVAASSMVLATAMLSL